MRVRQIIEWETPRASFEDVQELIWGQFRDFAPESKVRMAFTDISIISTEEKK